METIGVFTNYRTLANSFIEDLEKHSIYKTIGKRIGLNEISVVFENCDIIKWLNPSDCSRGNKTTKAFINEDVTQNQYETIVLPICVYCKPEDIVKIVI